VKCKCGRELRVTLSEIVAILQCDSCGRGEHILQAKPHEVFAYRARVTQIALLAGRELD
jgi:hypothetical protein